MPLTIAEVASEKGALLQRRGVDWRYEVEGETWSFRDTAGALSHLPLPQVPLPNAATAVARCAPAGLPWMTLSCAQGSAMRCSRTLSDNQRRPRVILDVAHNPHAAAYLAGRLKTLAKRDACWRLLVCCMIRISPARWPIWPRKSMHGTARRWKARAARRQSSWWNICAAVQSIAAWRRRGVRPWLTLKWKIPCWCVVRFTP